MLISESVQQFLDRQDDFSIVWENVIVTVSSALLETRIKFWLLMCLYNVFKVVLEPSKAPI